MFITISKSNGRYGFILGDNPTDPYQSFIYSEADYKLIPGALPSYPTFREAHSHASQVVTNMPSLILSRKASVFKKSDLGISPEDSAISTLEEQPEVLDGMLTQIKGALEHERADKLDALIQSVDQSIQGAESIVEEVHSDDNKERLENIIKRLKLVKKSAERERNQFAPKAPEVPAAPSPDAQAPMPPAQPAQPLSPFASQKIAPGFATDCLRAFGETAAQSIEATHPESYLKYIEQNENGYQVLIAEGKKDICILSFTKDLLLDGIFPTGSISKQSAYHSNDFFERYWEPIVYAVGHYLNHENVIVPNHMKSSRRLLAAWDLNKKKLTAVALTLPKEMTKTSQTWGLKRLADVVSQDWNQAQVRCTKQLPSYYQRTGVVQSVINRGAYLDINVDFGRGLGVVTMTNNDLEKITNLS